LFVHPLFSGDIRSASSLRSFPLLLGCRAGCVSFPGGIFLSHRRHFEFFASPPFPFRFSSAPPPESPRTVPPFLFPSCRSFFFRNPSSTLPRTVFFYLVPTCVAFLLTPPSSLSRDFVSPLPSSQLFLHGAVFPALPTLCLSETVFPCTSSTPPRRILLGFCVAPLSPALRETHPRWVHPPQRPPGRPGPWPPSRRF